METYSANKQQLKNQLNVLHDKIHQLDTRAEKLEAAEKLQYVKELDVLHTHKRKIIKKLIELEDADGGDIDAVKVPSEDAWEGLRRAIA
jgi:hypothetical protein